MTDLAAVHYPEKKGEEIAVVYHLHNLVENIRIRYKVFTELISRMFSVLQHYFKQQTGWKEKPMIFTG